MKNQNDRDTELIADQDNNALASIKSILESSYYKELQALEEFVVDKRADKTEIGKSGFILYFENGGWAAVYRQPNNVGFDFGDGEIPNQVKQNVNSVLYDTVKDPSMIDQFYAGESIDIADHINKCFGKRIVGIIKGADTFSFGFLDGGELAIHLATNEKGEPLYMVFWEQW